MSDSNSPFWSQEDRDCFITAAKRMGANTSHYNGKDWSVWFEGSGTHLCFEDISRRVYYRSEWCRSEWLTGGLRDWFRVLITGQYHGTGP